MEFLIILGVIVLAHIAVIAKGGFASLIGLYITGSVIWIFFPGYDTGFGGWILTQLVIVGLAAVGSVLPGGATGIAVAGVGGYLIGKKLAKL